MTVQMPWHKVGAVQESELIRISVFSAESGMRMWKISRLHAVTYALGIRKSEKIESGLHSGPVASVPPINAAVDPIRNKKIKVKRRQKHKDAVAVLILGP